MWTSIMSENLRKAEHRIIYSYKLFLVLPIQLIIPLGIYWFMVAQAAMHSSRKWDGI